MDSHSQLGEWNAVCVTEEVSLIWRIQIYGLLFMDIVLLKKLLPAGKCEPVRGSEVEQLQIVLLLLFYFICLA